MDRRSFLYTIASSPAISLLDTTKRSKHWFVSGYKEDLSIEYKYEDGSETDHFRTEFEWILQGQELCPVLDRMFCLPRLDLTYFSYGDPDGVKLVYKSENDFNVILQTGHSGDKKYYMYYYEEGVRDSKTTYADTHMEIIHKLADEGAIF